MGAKVKIINKFKIKISCLFQHNLQKKKDRDINADKREGEGEREGEQESAKAQNSGREKQRNELLLQIKME